MAWNDYQKAFDRMPYSWIIKSLEITGINTKVISFPKKVTGEYICAYMQKIS
jgi:hypothetical protein